jgi:phosphodiesterase/alkaline phosphatase D-like protein
MFAHVAARVVHLIGLGMVIGIHAAVHPLAAQRLTHGPIVGGVTSSAGRFYLRSDTTASVNVQLSTSILFTSPITGTAQTTVADNDFAALIRVDGLQPNRRYYYRALVNGQPVFDVREFQTFPPEGSRDTFKFTFGSCQQVKPWQHNPIAGQVYRTMAIEQPRFFLQIGDWGYPDTTDSESEPTDFFTMDKKRLQASYRAKYDPSYPMQWLLRVAPVDYVYDDHDYVNNNSSAFATNVEGEVREIELPPEARQNSIQCYQQLFPGYSPANPDGGIWHKFSFGTTDFFVLDVRSARSRNLEALMLDPVTNRYRFAPPPGHSILAGDPSLIGENQRDWLFRELRASQADWKFIVSPVPFNYGLHQLLEKAFALQDSVISLPLPAPVDTLVQFLALRVAIGLMDLWAGFPEDQIALVNFLHENAIRNVIVLSGDSHTAAIDSGGNAKLPEIMAGALDHDNSFLVALLDFLGIHIWDRGGQNLETLNFFDAYGRVTVFGADSVRLEIVDELGKVLARHTVLKDAFIVQPITAVAERKTGPVEHFALSPAYPNPLRVEAAGSQATIRYLLPTHALVTATVYDLLGRTVRRWQQISQPAGEQTLLWNGEDDRGELLASGVYLISVQVIFQNGKRQMAIQRIALVR